MSRIRKVILAVDDDPVVLEAVNISLGDKYNVLVASDGHEGIQLAEAQIPDLIILDIMMPGFDGFSTLMLIKESEVTKDIPVIMLTAVGKKEKILAAFRDGATDYILKPFKADILIEKVDALFRRMDMEEQHKKNQAAAETPESQDPES